MNAREKLDAKLEAADRAEVTEKRWLRLFAFFFVLWTVFIVPLAFFWQDGRFLGGGLTLYFSGTALLVVFTWWRAEHGNAPDE